MLGDPSRELERRIAASPVCTSRVRIIWSLQVRLPLVFGTNIPSLVRNCSGGMRFCFTNKTHLMRIPRAACSLTFFFTHVPT